MKWKMAAGLVVLLAVGYAAARPPYNGRSRLRLVPVSVEVDGQAREVPDTDHDPCASNLGLDHYNYEQADGFQAVLLYGEPCSEGLDPWPIDLLKGVSP